MLDGTTEIRLLDVFLNEFVLGVLHLINSDRLRSQSELPRLGFPLWREQVPSIELTIALKSILLEVCEHL